LIECGELLADLSDVFERRWQRKQRRNEIGQVGEAEFLVLDGEAHGVCQRSRRLTP